MGLFGCEFCVCGVYVILCVGGMCAVCVCV